VPLLGFAGQGPAPAQVISGLIPEAGRSSRMMSQPNEPQPAIVVPQQAVQELPPPLPPPVPPLVPPSSGVKSACSKVAGRVLNA